jgi:hypothetical protein
MDVVALFIKRGESLFRDKNGKTTTGGQRLNVWIPSAYS